MIFGWRGWLTLCKELCDRLFVAAMLVYFTAGVDVNQIKLLLDASLNVQQFLVATLLSFTLSVPSVLAF